jgi:hypothetical protein
LDANRVGGGSGGTSGNGTGGVGSETAGRGTRGATSQMAVVKGRTEELRWTDGIDGRERTGSLVVKLAELGGEDEGRTGSMGIVLLVGEEEWDRTWVGERGTDMRGILMI